LSPEENTNSAPTDKKEESKSPEAITFCWQCGADIINQAQRDYCANCNAPLDEDVRSKIFARSEPAYGVNCWRCGGTTSGNICGICGSPITKEGLNVLVKTPTPVEEAKEISQVMAVYSPKDKQFKAIDVTFDELKDTIEKYLEVTNSQITEAGPVFFVARPEEVNIAFEKLRNDSFIKEKLLKVIIRNEQINPNIKEIVLRFFYWKPETKKERFKFKTIGWNIGLFVATIITVSLAGWQYAKLIYEQYLFTGTMALDIFLFTFSLILILTVHEFGHYTISRLKKFDTSLPYFIPIPPIPGFQTLGTFGALIRQKEPFTTRDDLFDIGIAGPIAGFIVTIPIFLIGLKLTYVVDIVPSMMDYDPTQVPTVLLMNLFLIIGEATGIVPYVDVTTQTIAMHPMMFAGYVGLLLTGLNLVPASQLDGGHTARAVFGGTSHRIVSIVFALLLAANPFTRYFGFLVLIMSFRQHPGAIDDVSKVHWSKYIYITIGFIVAITCLPLPINLLQSYFQNWFG